MDRNDFKEESFSVWFEELLSCVQRENVYSNTLLFLHIGEVFKCEGPHRGSPESISLHDRLQAGPDKETDRHISEHNYEAA